jgi:4-alpha-glucanotransferase
MGDVAFYVGYDSVEVYNNRSFFELDYNGDMLFVAGVGPDYFSSTGQLWGNPLYLWDKLKNIDYKFIIDRINLDIYDIIRIDHFRAFDSYYKIAFGSSDAKMGKWVKGPGEDVVERLKDLDIEVVVEDLGLVPKSVYQLRDKYGLTHMKIVQFLDSFDEQFCENSIIYTGTHDNQTLVSWYEGLNDENKKNVNSYFKIYDNKINVNKILINYTLHANSKYCIISIVDLLCLSDDERINKPGTIDDDNWSFKLSSYQKLDEVINDVSKMVKKARR